VSYRPLVEHLVSSVVENPDQVRIEEEVDGHSRTFLIHCSPEDVGKVIGKSGRVVTAIRSVVSSIASKHRERAFVKVVTE
jgi:hypothetical protein